LECTKIAIPQTLINADRHPIIKVDEIASNTASFLLLKEKGSEKEDVVNIQIWVLKIAILKHSFE